MERGKKICNALKEIRKRIADANGIPYESEECRHEGDCLGTCPKCEDELRYLQEKIEERAMLGLPMNTDNMMTCECLNMEASIEAQDSESDEIFMGQCVPPDNCTFPSKLMKALLSENEYDNIVFSPIGIAYILAMLQNGMKLCKDYKRIDELIGAFPFETRNQRRKGFRLSHAISLWFNNEIGMLKESYVKKANEKYGADAYMEDFGQGAGIIGKMNKWVTAKTHGNIKGINADVSPSTIMLIIDALYMKAKWRHTFETELTERKPFYNADGSKSMVDMMFQCFNDPYYHETNEYQAMLLPCCGGDHGMVIVKPMAGVKLDNSMITCMKDWERLWEWRSANTDVDLYMPRVKVENSLRLTDILKEMGLKNLFHQDNLFTNITDAPASVSEICQQCAIEINEDGTKAAAVTLAIKLGCLPPDTPKKHYKMKLDRPFGFAIMDFIGTPLFIGVVKTLPDQGKTKRRKTNDSK